MKKEEKEILFKDLCARLPYSVLVKTKKYSFPIELRYLTLDKMPDVKPYLRPISSMTKEEYDSLAHLHLLGNNTHSYRMDSSGFIFEGFKSYTLGLLNWLNENHFDYRGLIPMGLALEAPEGMYDFQKENRDE